MGDVIPFTGVSLHGLRYVPCRLIRGDSLDSLAKLYGVSAAEITEANGVKDTPGTCEWGRAIARMVLHEEEWKDAPGPKGVRCAPSEKTPNKCEPGQGFPCFVEAQILLLPDKDVPSRRFPVDLSKEAPASSGGGFNLWGLAILGVGLATSSVGISALGVATTIGIGPLGQLGR